MENENYTTELLKIYNPNKGVECSFGVATMIRTDYVDSIHYKGNFYIVAERTSQFGIKSLLIPGMFIKNLDEGVLVQVVPTKKRKGLEKYLHDRGYLGNAVFWDKRNII